MVFGHVCMPIICIAFRSLLLLLLWPHSAAPERLGVGPAFGGVRLVGGALAHFNVLIFLIEALVVGVLLIVHWRL